MSEEIRPTVNLTKTPQTAQPTSLAPEYSQVQSLKHFILLNIASLGLYQIYWMYKNWKLIQKHYHLELTIPPLLRAIFPIFFIYGFLKRIYSLAQEKNFSKIISPGWNALGYILILFAIFLFELWIFAYFSFIPLTSSVKALNFYWQQETPHLSMRTKFTKGEMIFLIIGFIILLLALFGIFI